MSLLPPPPHCSAEQREEEEGPESSTFQLLRHRSAPGGLKMAALTTDGTERGSEEPADGTGEPGAEARAPPPDHRQELPCDAEHGADMEADGGDGGDPSPGPHADKEPVPSTECGDSDGKTTEKLCEPPGESPGGPASLAGSSETQPGEQRAESGRTKPGGRPAEPGPKRRASLEISSSDGEPLSRMDSEDSISSTLMDAESGASSGRSTPAMMNGHGGGVVGGVGVGVGGAGPAGAGPVAMAVGPPGAGGVKPAPGYTCCWDHCHLQNPSSPDLAEHIRALHVDPQRGGVFVCLWKGCKVYNTPSTSHSWLQRHMLTHSGDKPFKCVVGGCNATFASQGGLARHVPTHFSSGGRPGSNGRLKEESPSKAGLNKRRKLKSKRRRSLPRPHDFFDAQTMDAIRHRAICLNLATHIESLGNGHSAVFHSTVIARRKEESGKVKLLLHWSPEDILPDVWVNESDRQQQKTKVVHLSKLATDTALLLDPSIYRMFF
ncbi:unnamed protein product [Boreogadus saida]